MWMSYGSQPDVAVCVGSPTSLTRSWNQWSNSERFHLHFGVSKAPKTCVIVHVEAYVAPITHMSSARLNEEY